MWLGNRLIQLKIDSFDPVYGTASKPEVFHFAGCSFMVFVKKSTYHEVGCKVALCVFLNCPETRDLISSVSVLISSARGHLEDVPSLRKQSNNNVLVYLEDVALKSSKSQHSLLFSVHLKMDILHSVGWPSQSLTLWEAARGKRFTDVLFRVEGNEFAAHKAMLCISSPVFEAMFLSKMKEAQSGVVDIEDITAETFQEFLRFVYTGYVADSQTLETLRGELSAVADKYDVFALRILSSSPADAAICTMCRVMFQI